ncbi:MAG: fused MFS/spermidine synthase, partial [Planctomycetaceae bacterium]|nr:fused MFS/spermidine synthase [Planctomycetaceae bacterium]
WIDVVHDVRNDRWQVRQNLHYSHGASGGSASRERRQGHLPLLLHPHPDQVLFLGLGTGITASAVRTHPSVTDATIVELIPEVVEAAKLLSEFNADILNAPNVCVVVDDARHFLSATPQRFDVIVADLYVPWESQTGYLYTVEHFEQVCRHMNKGGLFCQWLPLYQVGTKEFEWIANSFATVFPHTTIWWGQIDAKRPIVALIGTEQPLLLPSEELSRRISHISNLADGTDAYLGTPENVLSLCAGVWTCPPAARLNTDEYPQVEFSAPISQGDATLLTGRSFRRWYDAVLSQIPEASLSGFPRTAATIRPSRLWVRELLFGTSSSTTEKNLMPE